MQQGDLHKVWEIRALKRRPRHDEAKQILERIAKQVQPIMRRHNWRVKVLSEMCPKRRQLLGLNVGAGIEVKLRLRRPDRELEFLPFDQVLDTMLHELCHNAHGPHNASFYQLWDQLRKECEELMSMGIRGTGEGFDLPGKRLGGVSRPPPLSSLRKTALAAAENRQRLNTLLPSGPRRLGGDKNIMSALSPVQAAAMAAERRLQDEIWCASASRGLDVEEEGDAELSEMSLLSGHTVAQSSALASNNASLSGAGFRKRSQQSHDTSFIDLTSDINPDTVDVHDARCSKKSCCSGANSSSMSANDSSKANRCSSSLNNPESGSFKYTAVNERDGSAMWNCETCTLLNPPLALVCEACETLKPKDASMKYNFWSCKFCTLENSISLEKCSACSQWRYSYGPPLSTPPPNLGT
uniref:WLM domain-containing protein n=1 Tax=Opuntia streptacantha TaxID=393608 RepID=A0A7C9F9J7_OPUST